MKFCTVLSKQKKLNIESNLKVISIIAKLLIEKILHQVYTS